MLFLAALGCYAMTCVMVFDQNLLGTILFGCGSLACTWLAGRELRSVSRTENHNHLHHHYGDQVSYYGPSPYMADGSLSPFATPEAIQRFHTQMQIPDKLPPVTIYVDREYRVVERPVLAEPEGKYRGELRTAEAEPKPVLTAISKPSHRPQLPAPKKQSLISAVVMGPRKRT